jgi:hypothetical protein
VPVQLPYPAMENAFPGQEWFKFEVADINSDGINDLIAGSYVPNLDQNKVGLLCNPKISLLLFPRTHCSWNYSSGLPLVCCFKSVADHPVVS